VAFDFKTVLSGLVLGLGALCLWPALGEANSGISPQTMKSAAPAGSPQIAAADYRGHESVLLKGPRGIEHHREHLWIKLRNHNAEQKEAVLEPIWGRGPADMKHVWGRTHSIRNGEIFVHPGCRAGHRDQPFTLGVRVRIVRPDGSLSPASAPVFIHYQGDARSSNNSGADRIFLFALAASLLGFFVLYRRHQDIETRIRLAAATALCSLLFLTVTPALSWLKVEDPAGILPTVDCALGDEVQCATYVPDGGPNPIAAAASSQPRRAELSQWMACSSSVRSGLVLSLILLLPALIWLLVVPRLRAAQCSVFIGATAAGYTMLTSLLYLLTVPSWMTTSSYRTAEVTLLCCGAIVVAAGLIVRDALTLERPSEIPRARVLR
jgi:hypothetical protein